MTEDVVPASVLGDETEALRVVEPLHGTSRHSERSFSFGLQGCRPAPTVGFVGAVVLYRSGGSAVKTPRGDPATLAPRPGHLAHRADEHLARLGAVGGTDDPFPFHALDHARG